MAMVLVGIASVTTITIRIGALVLVGIRVEVWIRIVVRFTVRLVVLVVVGITVTSGNVM